MDTAIFFYTSTGNSLWTARKLAQNVENAELIPVALTVKGAIRSEARKIGIIFPVHIWGLPAPIIDFVGRLEAENNKYFFALAVNAGQVAATLLQLEKILRQKNLTLHSGFSICMPSNYIPWGGAISKDKQRELFQSALAKISTIAQIVRAGEKKPLEKGPFWQNIVLSALYRVSYAKVPRMDKSFRADEKCTGCGICAKICPTGNISLRNDRPSWQHRCEQCFACLQWCPAQAIQYGRNTAAKKRYTHPEISLKDMLASVPFRK